MVDANIIISAGLFPESIVGKTLAHVARNHKLVLSKYTLVELRNVFKRKFPDRIEFLEKFVKKLNYELIDIRIGEHKKYPKIRDMDDIPLLASAIEAKVDVLITGDKDFYEILIEIPKIMKPREYVEKYMS
jgi:putative PIN family toxin of toxin-antitoxin system